MKVGFVAPLSIAAVNGGVRTQATQTASALQNLGVDVDFVTPWQDSLKADIVHIFTANPETLAFIQKCSGLGIKTVLSPIFFANRSPGSLANILSFEKLIEKVGAGIRSEYGYKAEACHIADKIVPNTKAEADLIQKGFGIESQKITVIPNGVESRFTTATPDLFVDKFGLKDFVLFAGQAGAPRKNVKTLLQIAPDIDASVVIIGSFYDDEYGNACKQLAELAGNVTLLDTLPHDSELLASAYAACDTFVLPSLFETPGIAAMEAALAGAKVVITKNGGTKDYFTRNTEFLDPKSPRSILDATNKSLSANFSSDLKSQILENYSWDKVAEKTLAVYSSF